MRRSLEPGMRYPRRAPESNHLLTVRGATLQILATSPVVRTSFTLLFMLPLLAVRRTPPRACAAIVPNVGSLRLGLMTPGESVYAANISSIRLRALLHLRRFCRPRAQRWNRRRYRSGMVINTLARLFWDLFDR